MKSLHACFFCIATVTAATAEAGSAVGFPEYDMAPVMFWRPQKVVEPIYASITLIRHSYV